MSGDDKVVEKPEVIKKRPIIIIFIGTIVAIKLILDTLEVSYRNVNNFVTVQQKYIITTVG